MISTIWKVLTLGAAIHIVAPILHADEAPASLSAPVKRLSTPVPSPAAVEPQATRRPVSKPTTPAAKYPQYQLDQQHRNDDANVDSKNPAIRFLLVFSNQLLLIHATVTIDDQPFRALRQQRVERILNQTQTDTSALVTEQPDTVDAPATVSAKTSASDESRLIDRLRHTTNLTGKAASSSEVHWILNNWVDGPALLWLNKNFQRFRADQRPEFVVLDRDRDGVISPDELRVAVKSFQDCDVNRDDLVQFTEVALAASGPRFSISDTVVPQLIPLPVHESKTDNVGLPTRPATGQGNPPSSWRFDSNGDGQIDSEEMRSVQQATPDLAFAISFDTQNPDRSRLTLLAASSAFAPAVQQASVDVTGITTRVDQFILNFVAVQSQPGDQLSIGVVNDGYPILPAIDLNDDGRLSIRELRSLQPALVAMDRNHDGALSSNEVQSPIRICIGLGPIAHQELAGIRSIHNNRHAVPPGPEWFERMDRNKDHDLTRAEFPGTDEQFKALDADGDQLVSSAEAMEFDARTKAADSDDRSGKPQSDPTPAEVSKQETKPR